MIGLLLSAAITAAAPSDWVDDPSPAPPRVVALAGTAPFGTRGPDGTGIEYAQLPLAGRKILVAVLGAVVWVDGNSDGALTYEEIVKNERVVMPFAIGPGGATRLVELKVFLKNGAVHYGHAIRRESTIVLEQRARRLYLIDGNQDLRFDDARTDTFLLDVNGHGRMQRVSLYGPFFCGQGVYRMERGDASGEHCRFTPYSGPGSIPGLRDPPGEDALEAARAALVKGDAEQQRAAIELLCVRPNAADIKRVVRAGAQGVEPVRRAAIDTLRRLRDPDSVATVAAMLREKNLLRRDVARLALAGMPTPGAASALLKARRRARQSVEKAQLDRALLGQSNERVTNALLKGFDRMSVTERRAHLDKLFRRGVDWPAIEAVIISLLKQKSWEVRAVTLLGMKANTPLLAREALERLQDPVWQVRLAAAEVLEGARMRGVVLPLIEAMEKETNRRNRRALGLTLYRITGAHNGEWPNSWRRWWEDGATNFVVPLRVPPRDPPRKAKKNTGERKSVTSFYGIRLRSSRVIFLIDASGSMAIQDRKGGRARFDVALEELARSFNGLAPGARANVIFFSDRVRRWKPRITEIKPAMRKTIRKQLQAHVPKGGTYLYDGFEAAFKDRDADTIVLLSDGQPSGGKIFWPNEIEKAILDWNALHRLTIHCVVVGYHSPMLARIAKTSGGEYVKR